MGQSVPAYARALWQSLLMGWGLPGVCLWVVVVQPPCHVVTPHTAACQASLSLTTSWSLPKFMSLESVIPSNHLILRRPLLLIPSIFPTPGGGHGNPLQYSCLENPHEQRGLVGYSPWGHKELDTTEQ